MVGTGSSKAGSISRATRNFYGSHEGEALAWRNKLDDAQARFIKFAEDVLYTSRYDNHMKAMLRANKAASLIECDDNFQEALQEIKSLRASVDREKEKGDLDLVDTPTDTGDDECKKDLVIDICVEAGGDGSEPCSGKMKIPWAELPPEAKSEYQRAEAYLKAQLSIYVRLLHVPNGDDPLAPLLLTPAGKYVPDDGGQQRPKFVGIICDTRVLGESSHRPTIRLPPINYETLHMLLNAVRGRHGEEYNNRLHQSDLYLTLAGGRELPKLNGWFTKLDQTHAVATTRTVLVYFKEESLKTRYTRVSGVCSAKTHDTLKLTAQPWPAGKLRSVHRIHYPGTTSQADSMGPVIMPDLNDLQQAWRASWGTKKKIYGPNIVKVGGTDGYTDDAKEASGLAAPGESPGEEGTAGDEEADKRRAKPRNDDTVEPVFFHAMPVMFFEELIHDFSLGAVINIGVGDGALALACMRSRIPYTGFCLTEEHKVGVEARLEGQMLQGALNPKDKWYDPVLVKALTSAHKGSAAPPDTPQGSRKRPYPGQVLGELESSEKPKAGASKRVKAQAKGKAKGKGKGKGLGKKAQAKDKGTHEGWFGAGEPMGDDDCEMLHEEEESENDENRDPDTLSVFS